MVRPLQESNLTIARLLLAKVERTLIIPRKTVICNYSVVVLQRQLYKFGINLYPNIRKTLFF